MLLRSLYLPSKHLQNGCIFLHGLIHIAHFYLTLYVIINNSILISVIQHIYSFQLTTIQGTSIFFVSYNQQQNQAHLFLSFDLPYSASHYKAHTQIIHTFHTLNSRFPSLDHMLLTYLFFFHSLAPKNDIPQHISSLFLFHKIQLLISRTNTHSLKK